MRIPGISYANVTATVALIAALGGTSYAAVTVSGANVRNGTLTGADVKSGSLTGSDVKNSSLTASDVKNSTLTASDVKNGSLLAADFQAGQLPAGPAGPAGPQGPAGPAGPAGATTVITRRAEVNVPGFAQREQFVSCLDGETVVGGGAGISGLVNTGIAEDAPIEADGTRPEDGEVSTGWSARGGNAGGSPQTLNVFVLCARP